MDGDDITGKVANTTAKIVSKLLKVRNHTEYRDTTMWREGSRIFNGNLLPLGKPKIRTWPDEYKELFLLNYDDFAKNIDSIKSYRCTQFKKFRNKKNPQAIVCFGKTSWPDFENVFINNPEDKLLYDEYRVAVYETDRVILTYHFSYGRWVPNKTVEFVANKL